jgi:hypothetical protein
MTSPTRFLAAGVTLVAAALSASVARADAPRTRDGLYLSIGAGASGLSMSRSGHVSAGGSAPTYVGDSSIAGGGGSFELTLGGTLRPGLVLAGTLVDQTVGSPSLHSDAGDVPLDGQLHYGLLGATLAWFPEPNGGFHLGGTLALARAWAHSPPPHFAEYLGGAGGAIAFDAGYLWWVSDQWSLGLNARLSAARLHGQVTQLGVTGSEDDSVGAFMLAFSAAYH